MIVKPILYQIYTETNVVIIQKKLILLQILLILIVEKFLTVLQ